MMVVPHIENRQHHNGIQELHDAVIRFVRATTETLEALTRKVSNLEAQIEAIKLLIAQEPTTTPPKEKKNEGTHEGKDNKVSTLEKETESEEEERNEEKEENTPQSLEKIIKAPSLEELKE